MKHLLLIRHAKSDWDIKEFPDFGRGLNKRGLREAAELKNNLNTIIKSIDLFVCSPAVRTIQTLSIVLGNEITNSELVYFEPHLYLAESYLIEKIVNDKLNQFKSIAIVGHNNGISDYLNSITNNKYNLEFPTGSWALLQKSATNATTNMASNWQILEKSW
jgi:phosphohistidine phosphatase